MGKARKSVLKSENRKRIKKRSPNVINTKCQSRPHSYDKHKWGTKKSKCSFKNANIRDPNKTTNHKNNHLKSHQKDTKASLGQTNKLRERMIQRLSIAKFRQTNEKLDSTSINDHKTTFDSLNDFEDYHQTYSEIREQWPVDPLDSIILHIKKNITVDKIIADFGCGDARLAASIPHCVHSFDLYALNDRVTACDMSNTPLNNKFVDVSVFCLSLMGADVSKYILEASRVLKKKGLLYIVEASSRFSDPNAVSFCKRLKLFGFLLQKMIRVGDDKKTSSSGGPSSSNVFLFLRFIKIRPGLQIRSGPKSVIPPVKLLPSLYKKR